MDFISILNDVIGPVMRGPSSSHNAGAYHIGKIIASFINDKPVKIKCIFDPEGSMAPTYIPLGVHYALAAGILKWDMKDNRFFSIFDFLKKKGIQLSFSIERITEDDHPNAMKIILIHSNDDKLTFCAKAVGGGGFIITKLDTWKINLDGKRNVCLIRSDKKNVNGIINVLKQYKNILYSIKESPKEEDVLLEISSSFDIPKALINKIRNGYFIIKIWKLEPVFYLKKGKEIFSDSKNILKISQESKLSLGDIALLYESTLLGLEKEIILEEIENRISVMVKSVSDGFESENVSMKLSVPYAGNMMESVIKKRTFIGNINTRAAIRAISAMHISNSNGVICAAPTGGSAGVLPGVLDTLLKEKESDKSILYRAFCAAGAIGVLFLNLATFAAEDAGCQVEIGVAGAMAAAAVIEAAGGTAKEAMDGAAVALQNTMGLACDPVHGTCEIPCQTRNGVAASNAFICADLILAGYPNQIPLEETIIAAYETGKSLSSKLKCTVKGGLSIAPSALAIKELR